MQIKPKFTLTFPDGYNGHVLQFDSEPIEEDLNCVKLRCVTKGKEHFTRWVSIQEYNHKMIVWKV